MDEPSIIQASIISNYPWYPSIHDIQLFKISKYPWYPTIQVSMISNYVSMLSNYALYHSIHGIQVSRYYKKVVSINL